MISTDDAKKFALWLNSVLKPYNYQISPNYPAGSPGKNQKDVREFRLQLIDKNSDTSDRLISVFPSVLKQPGVNTVQFNKISPNSSKFPSYSLSLHGDKLDLVIGRGANKGENFETNTVANLAGAFGKSNKDSSFIELIDQLNSANKEFAKVEIISVKQRTGSTKKEGIPIEKLGAIIGDIVLKDSIGNDWFISLKDTNGSTFSSYSGAASLFNANGDLQENSAGADFLRAFGADLSAVQDGFDLRNKKKVLRKKIKPSPPNKQAIKAIFERAWGMNYFYVRKLSSGWKVFWIDRNKLNEMTDIITSQIKIKYPNEKSKQISIECGNSKWSYLIELRNSKAGEYPNDTKFKVK